MVAISSSTLRAPCRSILALWVPLLPPAPHLLDLPLLGAHDVPCDLLYARVVALFLGYRRHLYGRLVVRDHGVDERLVEGFALRQPLWIHHHAHAPHLLGGHLHRHGRSAKLFILDGFELLDLGLLGGDDVPGELLNLLVLGVLEGYLGHGYGTLVVRNHRVDESPVRVLAVLHNHLPGHATGAHAHRAMAHLIVVHAALLGRAVLVIAGVASLLSTAGAPASGQDECCRQQQR